MPSSAKWIQFVVWVGAWPIYSITVFNWRVRATNWRPAMLNVCNLLWGRSATIYSTPKNITVFNWRVSATNWRDAQLSKVYTICSGGRAWPGVWTWSRGGPWWQRRRRSDPATAQRPTWGHTRPTSRGPVYIKTWEVDQQLMAKGLQYCVKIQLIVTIVVPTTGKNTTFYKLPISYSHRGLWTNKLWDWQRADHIYQTQQLVQ